jgi:hypothetical protein
MVGYGGRCPGLSAGTLRLDLGSVQRKRISQGRADVLQI